MGLRRGTALLLAAGVVSEAVYLAAVVRLPWWRFGSHLTGWSDILGEEWRSFAACLAGVGGLVAAYLLGWCAVRSGEGTDRPVWGGAVVFAATLFWLQPITSDLFIYLSQSHLFTDLGANPLLHALSEFAADGLLAAYPAVYATQPSVYGPAWILLAAPGTLGQYDVAWGLFYLKGLLTVAFLSSAWLVQRIVGQVRPVWAQEGLYLLAWNPLVLLLGVGDGHNDLVMMAVVLLAFYWLLCQRWAPAFGALTLAVWIKYVPVILFPPFLLYAWRQARRCGQSPWSALRWGLGAVAGISVLLLVPLDGAEWVVGQVWRLMHPLNWPQGGRDAAGWALWGGLLLLAVAYVVLVRQAICDRGPFQRLADIGWASLLLLFLLGAARSQPWHLIWPLALAALVGRRWVWWVLTGLAAVLLAAQVWVEWGAPGLEIL